MTSRQEIRLLQLAVERRLLSWDQVEKAVAATPFEPGRAPEGGRWGPRIAALLAAGEVEEATFEELAAELWAAAAAPEVPPAAATAHRGEPAGGAAESAGGAEEPTHVALPRPPALGPVRPVPPSPVAPESGDAAAAAATTADPPAADGSSAAAGEAEDDLAFLAGWERYQIVSFLGAGGMGRVYKAYDPSLKRYLALKFLRWNDPRQIERFLREARSQARVEHPYVCKVYETGRVEGRPYIAMQYIDGDTLGGVVGRLTSEQRVAVIRDVARAVHAAHRGGLIHRDIKPGNILLEELEGGFRPYVVDFGLAQDQDAVSLTRSGSVTGTPAYLSPEQAQAGSLDRRSDVYSLGIVLYEVLCGRVPFQGASFAESLLKAIQEEPPPLRRVDPRIPQDLETITHKCLQKDPERRYPSARALAEDLDRYLDGEPIQARPPSWTYRAAKWIRRNRAAAVVAAAAAVLLLALGAASLVAQWRAAERAQLARRFGREVEQFDSSTRLVALMPLHDTTAHKQWLRQRMERIEAEVERLGWVGEGPGEYALGSGYLALRQYQRAYEHLVAAWRSGYRDPEVALGLGQVLWLLDRRAQLEAAGQSLEEVRETREELGRIYREPALAYLREGYGSTADPYVGAMVAYLEGRYDDALAQAREALDARPWFYEARYLEAEVHVERGDGSLERGEREAAAGLYATAGTLYRGLLEVARSDPSIYAAECGRLLRIANAEVQVGRLAEETLAAALSRCQQALVADPELTDAYTVQAHIYRLRGRFQARHGQDPEPDLRHAIAIAEQALALDADDVQAHHQRGAAYRTLAIWEGNHGGDPFPSFGEAVASHGEATRLHPEGALSHNSLGSAYLTRGRFEMRRGVDPRRSFELAADSFERSIAASPSFALPHTNIAVTWLWRSEDEAARGLDPRPSLGRSIDASRQAIALNPSYPPLRNNLGTAFLNRAEAEMLRDGDPGESLDQAVAAFSEALELDPSYGFSHFNIAAAHRMRAQHLLDRGRDPGAALAAAQRSLAAAAAIDPTDYENHLEAARLELIGAGWEARAGRSPEAALAAADRALAAGLGLNRSEPGLYQLRAEVYRRQAEGAFAQGSAAAAAEAARRGLAAAAEALALNPKLAEALAVEGALCTLLARVGADGGTDLARRAVERLDEAIGLNPHLERQFGALRQEAAGLLGSGS